MTSYIAVLRKQPNSDFGIEFPDVPGCFSAASCLNEAYENAAEALALHLEGEERPPPRSLLAVVKKLTNEDDDLFALMEVEVE